MILYFGVQSGSLPLIFAGWAAGFLLSGLAMALPFSVLADSVDYGEWKTGIRAAGLLTAVGAAFLPEGGQRLGRSAAGVDHGCLSLRPQHRANRGVAGGNQAGVHLAAGGFFALAAIPVFFYYRYEKLEPRIREELRAAAGPGNEQGRLDSPEERTAS